MTPDEWNAFIQQHGGQAGDPAPLNPTITTNGVKGPNPNPNLRYTFKDGTSIVVTNGTAHPADAQGNTPPPDKIIVNGGTAYKPAAGTTAATAPRIVKDDQGRLYSEDPKTGALTPQTGDTKTNPPKSIAGNPAEKQLPILNSDGTVTWVDNSNYDPEAEAAKVAKTKADTEAATARAGASTASASASTAKADATTAATAAGQPAATVAKTQAEAQLAQDKAQLAQEQAQLAQQKQYAISPAQQQQFQIAQEGLNYRQKMLDAQTLVQEGKLSATDYANETKRLYDDSLTNIKQIALVNQTRGQDVNLLDTELRATGNIADMAVRSPAMSEVVRGLVTPSAMAAYNANIGSLQQGAGITPTPVTAGPVPDLGQYGISVAANALKAISPLAAQLMGQGVVSNATANGQYTAPPAQAGVTPSLATQYPVPNKTVAAPPAGTPGSGTPPGFVPPPFSAPPAVGTPGGVPFGLGQSTGQTPAGFAG